MKNDWVHYSRDAREAPRQLPFCQHTWKLGIKERHLLTIKQKKCRTKWFQKLNIFKSVCLSPSPLSASIRHDSSNREKKKEWLVKWYIYSNNSTKKKNKYQIEIKSFSFTGNRTIRISLQICFSCLFLRPFPLKFTVFHVYLIFFLFATSFCFLLKCCLYFPLVISIALYFSPYSLRFEFRRVAFLVPIENHFYCTYTRACLCNIYCKLGRVIIAQPN